jgi:hydroxypyruvate isomerase
VITIDVCMETVFPDVPYLDRPARIAAAGFKAIEAWFPDQHLAGADLPKLRRACESAGVKLNNIVANSPDGRIGGSLTNPADRPQYLARVQQAQKCCQELGVSMMITCTGNVQPALSHAVQRASIVDGLRAAGDLAARGGVTLVLEPLNSLVDHPGYFLDQPEAAAAIVREVGHLHVALLFDIYHMQIMQGDLIATIKKNIQWIGHFHTAGVPGRHELDENQEIYYPAVMRAIVETGYQGYVAHEYSPMRDPIQSLVQAVKACDV